MREYSGYRELQRQDSGLWLLQVRCKQANHPPPAHSLLISRFLLDETMTPTLSKTFCGSLLYASPEIIKGIPYNPKVSDVWAFGVVVFTLLNKSMPFDDDNAKVGDTIWC